MYVDVTRAWIFLPDGVIITIGLPTQVTLVTGELTSMAVAFCKELGW